MPEIVQDAVQEIWRRIHAWLAAGAPELLPTLRRAATDADIAAAERATGLAFPDDYRESLRVHDGQATSATGLVLSWRLRPVGEVVATWAMMERLAAEGIVGTCDDPGVRITGPVRPRWWDARWLPVATDGGGNELALDLAPPPGGVPGQVITVWTDAPQREVIAPGFRAWLGDLADGLEAGRYVASYGASGALLGIEPAPDHRTA